MPGPWPWFCYTEANCQISLGGIYSLRDMDPGGKSVGDTWEVWAGASTLLGTSFFWRKKVWKEGGEGGKMPSVPARTEGVKYIN